MPSLYSFVSTQSGRSLQIVYPLKENTPTIFYSEVGSFGRKIADGIFKNFTSMTHPVIWTHFILANLPFQDFPNHIYCLQHLKRIWRETVHGSPGRTHSCNHPPLHWKIQGCWQLLGPYSHAMPNGRWLAFLLDFCSTEKLLWRQNGGLWSQASIFLFLSSLIAIAQAGKHKMSLISTHGPSSLPDWKGGGWFHSFPPSWIHF